MSTTNTQTPAGYWSLFQLGIPLAPVFAGLFIITVIPGDKLAAPKSYLDLLNGVVLALLGLSLVGNVVCSFFSSTPPSVTERTQQGTWILFFVVFGIAVMCVTIELLTDAISKFVYLLVQFILAASSSVLGFKART